MSAAARSQVFCKKLAVLFLLSRRILVAGRRCEFTLYWIHPEDVEDCSLRFHQDDVEDCFV